MSLLSLESSFCRAAGCSSSVIVLQTFSMANVLDLSRLLRRIVRIFRKGFRMLIESGNIYWISSAFQLVFTSGIVTIGSSDPNI